MVSHACARLARLLAVAVFAALCLPLAAAPHPMDPLTADEIVEAANILLRGRAARPGAIFQSIELREPGKAEVLGFRGSAGTRRATVFFRQDKKSYKSTVNLSAQSFTPPVLIPPSEGQLGLTITEVVDFSFVFQDQAFLNALALRGIRSAAQLQKVFVTPLTPGSFGLPEEAAASSTRDAATRSASRSDTSCIRTAGSSRCSTRPTTRAGFIAHNLWITAFDADERYAAGDTPNQNPGAPGLPQYVRDNESLVNRDIVLWLTIGHHHVTLAQDWPVLSRETLSFELKPANFFDHNPAADLRRAPFAVRR